jgi:hypothetical protein
MTKIILAISILMLLVGTSLAQANTDLRHYTIEVTGEDGIIIHTDFNLPVLGLESAYRTIEDDKWLFPNKTGIPSPFMEEVSLIKGLSSIHIENYKIQLFKLTNAKWGPIKSKIIDILETEWDSNLALRQLPQRENIACKNFSYNSDQIFAPIKQISKKIEIVNFFVECEPNPDMITLHFNTKISNKDFEFSTPVVKYIDIPKLSDLMFDLLRIKGVNEVFIKPDQITINKSAIFEWQDILKQVAGVHFVNISKKIYYFENLELAVDPQDLSIVRKRIPVNFEDSWAYKMEQIPYKPTVRQPGSSLSKNGTIWFISNDLQKRPFTSALPCPRSPC